MTVVVSIYLKIGPETRICLKGVCFRVDPRKPRKGKGNRNAEGKETDTSG